MIGGIGQGNMMERFQEMDAESFSSKVMSKLDVNGDGVISADELESDEFGGKLIAEMDGDEDGSLTSEELQSGFDKISSSIDLFSQNMNCNLFQMRAMMNSESGSLQAPPPPPPPPPSEGESDENDTLSALMELLQSGNTDSKTISAVMESFGSEGSESSSDSLLDLLGSSSDEEGEYASVI